MYRARLGLLENTPSSFNGSQASKAVASRERDQPLLPSLRSKPVSAVSMAHASLAATFDFRRCYLHPFMFPIFKMPEQAIPVPTA
ncbi:hypothetical protein RGR602_PC00366 (plasmid) [Rhizobium gallicum bv. gallicum R602sp]|uniref:Uncharacterized protein n=1 Tax=Rhizobium gallicum bv. gallicum R602sp TaxID=1041138 RepID=A0A0B4XBF0_9HYPH|nr:hypothetical protein RGR602_PC00366 [Rhizobium gallicum bv. gallicum R602sp]